MPVDHFPSTHATWIDAQLTIAEDGDRAARAGDTHEIRIGAGEVDQVHGPDGRKVIDRAAKLVDDRRGRARREFEPEIKVGSRPLGA